MENERDDKRKEKGIAEMLIYVKIYKKPSFTNKGVQM